MVHSQLQAQTRPLARRPAPVQTPERYVRLSEEDLALLFGPDYRLTPRSKLPRADGFLAKERVTLLTDRGALHNVAILGPARSVTKIRLGQAALTLGVDAAARETCCAADSPNLALLSGKGMVLLRWFEGREERRGAEQA